MIKHIFSGYRGEEAAHKLVSIQGTFGDIREMFSIMSRQLANRHLGQILVIMLFWALLLLLLKKLTVKNIAYTLILSLPAILYFLTVTKISPYVIDRYITPVYGIIFGLTAAGIVMLTKITLSNVRTVSINYFIAALILCIGAFFFHTSYDR